MSPTKPSSSRSEPGLDLFRACAVLAMFAVHARRLQTAHGDGAGERLLDFLMWSEPFIAAAFAFMAGVSLVLARERAPSGFSTRTLRRSLLLYALACGLFVPQYGLELPDLLASPGILSALALGIASSALALSSARPELALGTLIAGVLALTAWLDASGVTIPGMNAGPGGAVPLAAFTSFGALAFRLRMRRGPRALVALSLVTLPLLGVVLLSRFPWTTVRASYYREHAGQLALVDLASDAPRVAMSFWNHSAAGAVALSAPLLAALGLALAAGKRVGSAALAAPFLVLGRHALLAYVVHLGLLGLVELAAFAPRSAAGTWLVVSALGASTTLGAWAFERWRELRTT